jgi:hypothetical protein
MSQTNPKRPKHRGIARAKCEAKCVSAEARQALYDAMHPHAKLAMIQNRPGNSAKEISRIQKGLANGKT